MSPCWHSWALEGAAARGVFAEKTEPNENLMRCLPESGMEPGGCHPQGCSQQSCWGPASLASGWAAPVPQPRGDPDGSVGLEAAGFQH